jgi:hypothetical protein
MKARRAEALPVGTVVKLKLPCLDNEPGVLGVVFLNYGTGSQVIFENGRYDGFARPAEEFDNPTDEIDVFLDVVRYDQALASYVFTNVIQLAADFWAGKFDAAFDQQAAAQAAAAGEGEACLDHLRLRVTPAVRVVAEVLAERTRQDNKWGEQDHKPTDWIAILTEEVGEAAKAALEGNRDDYRRECIQIAAVAAAMVESLDRVECYRHEIPSLVAEQFARRGQ